MKFTSVSFVTVGLLFAVFVGKPALADLRVVFDEGAPKDAFRFENVSTCTVSDTSLELDLSTSEAGLIFDVTDAGQGVEVYQPFEVVQGAQALAVLPQVVDGQSKLVLEIKELAPGGEIEFTIDVDDTIGQREITVSGSEIEGARVQWADGMQAIFSSSARATLPISGC